MMAGWGNDKDKGDYGQDYDHGCGPMPPMHHAIHHVIQRGDTFYNLSRAYHVPMESIVEMNPCADPDNLQVGQIVMIPCPHMVEDPYPHY